MASHAMVLYYLPTEQEGSRVAFCVGKRLGKAFWRNRVRRRMKEAFRRIEDSIPKGYHLVWVARRAANEIAFEELQLRMRRLLIKAGIIDDKEESPANRN